MSIEPLSISIGRKFSTVLATGTAWIELLAGFLVAAYILLLTRPAEPVRQTLLFLAPAMIIALAAAMAGQVFIRLALGRHRTRGSVARFGRYQLAAFGTGVSLGFGFSPAFLHAGPLGWVVGVTAGLILLGLSLLPFRSSDRRLPSSPPPPPASNSPPAPS